MTNIHKAPALIPTLGRQGRRIREVQGHSQLRSESEASLGSRRPDLKINFQKREREKKNNTEQDANDSLW